MHRRQEQAAAACNACIDASMFQPTGAERLASNTAFLRSQFETGLQFQSVNIAWGRIGFIERPSVGSWTLLYVGTRSHVKTKKRPPNHNVKMFTTGQWRYQSQRKTGGYGPTFKTAYFSKF